MTEKKLYTQEDLLKACSKLPEKELEAIWKQFDFNTLLGLINVEEKNRTSWKNEMLELLHRELNNYNAVNRLFDLLPASNITIYGDSENNDIVTEGTEK